MTTMNHSVRGYWEQEPCGSNKSITKETAKHSEEWFDAIEAYRYKIEPEIFQFAQFTRYKGKKLLEIGVGAGTDHLQWAKAGAECNGVDLTDAAIQATKERLALHNLHSNLQRIDAEILPFADASFDVVYSWGVIHHSENPEKIITEICRVLRPGGVFIGMLYGRYSAVTLKLWLRHGLLKLKPWTSFKKLLWNRMESVGTKGYTPKEIQTLFSKFSRCETKQYVTFHDRVRLPRWIAKSIPDFLGWFIAIHATK